MLFFTQLVPRADYEPTQNPPEDTGDDVSQTQARQNWKKIFAVKRFLRFSLTYIAMIHWFTEFNFFSCFSALLNQHRRKSRLNSLWQIGDDCHLLKRVWSRSFFTGWVLFLPNFNAKKINLLEALLYWQFHGTKSCIGCKSFFILVLKFGRNC